jgi:hypothetical protein
MPRLADWNSKCSETQHNEKRKTRPQDSSGAFAPRPAGYTCAHPGREVLLRKSAETPCPADDPKQSAEIHESRQSRNNPKRKSRRRQGNAQQIHSEDR